MKKNNKNQLSVKTAMCFLAVILFLLLSGCSGLLTEKDLSKGTIIFNFGGRSVSSTAVNMSNIEYIVTLYNENNKKVYGPESVSGKASIEIAPGAYMVDVKAYLNSAEYASGKIENVQVTAGSSTSVKEIAMKVDIAGYLKYVLTRGDTPIDLPLNFTLDSARWNKILEDIYNSLKECNIDEDSVLVNLDLSECGRSSEFKPDEYADEGYDEGYDEGENPGGLYSDGTFVNYNVSINNEPDSGLRPVYISTLILPNSTSAINGGAFEKWENLNSIIIPSGVTAIGAYAFSNCEALTTISIPDNVTTIGFGAFYYSGLTMVNIPDKVEIINDNVFSDCGSLTSVTIGSGVTYIGDSVFSGCESLTSVTFKSNSITFSSYFCAQTDSVNGLSDAYKNPNNGGAGEYNLIDGTWSKK
ncbi:MAG: leucine-rich repeat domain-containing protein [Treponema sp.]|jgi:hypothetical protein|nr:leucine-rich repeat domain-containing protein [Treponema sp.]